MKSTIEIIAEAKKQSPMKARRTGDGQEYYSYYEFPILAFDEFVRTLLESFGEEILEGLVAKGLIREADTTTRVEVGWRFEDSHGYCADELVESIRLKVKEIISSIGK